MKKLHSTSVGKDKTRGLQTPRFRLHTGDKNPNDVFVVMFISLIFIIISSFIASRQAIIIGIRDSLQWEK